MDVAATLPEAGFSCASYKSPRRALIRSFVQSRDRWKLKAQDRKVEIKRLRNHVASLKRGRDEWKSRSQALQGELAQVQVRIQELEEQLEAASKKKSS